MGRIIVLTGERGVGKSTVCRETVALAKSEGYTCGGLITLNRPNDVRHLLDVRSGDTRRLTLQPDEQPAVIQGRYRFDPETLRWGNSRLARATPCDLLVVDEIGPLELKEKWGWSSAFSVLRGHNYTIALTVVRPELVLQAQLSLPTSATTVLDVTLANRDDLPQALLKALERDMASD